jgi:hypothetical protein
MGAQHFHGISSMRFHAPPSSDIFAARLREVLPGRGITIRTGLFGDLAGNIERLKTSDCDEMAVVIEWEDLDPRLGVRSLGGWNHSKYPTSWSLPIKSGSLGASLKVEIGFNPN